MRNLFPRFFKNISDINIPKAPPIPKRIINQFDKNMLINTFNEWNKRYSENPKSFSNSLDENGNPVSNYGECCAIYFQKLWLELLKR